LPRKFLFFFYFFLKKKKNILKKENINNKRYILIHLDEKWFSDFYIKKFTNIVLKKNELKNWTFEEAHFFKIQFNW